MKLFLFIFPFFVLCKSPDSEKISEALGNLIGQNLRSLPIDLEALVRGLKEGCEGKDTSLNEEECLTALETLQQEAFFKTAEQNLREANEFLRNNAKNLDVENKEEGKLQVRIVQEGSGNRVESFHSPLVRYTGKFLNGQIFSSSLGEETLSLDSVIEGLSKGIQGMKEGEKRTLYVHPDLGFGIEDSSMPNALLIFEVELLRLDVVHQDILLSEQIAG